MKNSKKRGFTIVELVIVIAVIAILAGVLIPTFTSIIKKANEASDTALIKSLNTSLKADEVLTSKPATMYDALQVVKNDGYDLTKIKATASGNEILWDSVNNCFVYLKDDVINYIPDTYENGKQSGVALWKIVAASEELNATYSNYLADGRTGTVTATTGVDVGENTGVLTVTYSGSADVVIRTNSYQNNITVNTDANVTHYGNAGKVEIEKVATDSYHEFGNVRTAKIVSGNFVLESSASVTLLQASANATVSNSGSLDVLVAPDSVTVSGNAPATKSSATISDSTVAVIGNVSYDALTSENVANKTVILLKDYTNESLDLTGTTVVGNMVELKANVVSGNVTLKNIHTAGITVNEAFAGTLTFDGGLISTHNTGTEDKDAAFYAEKGQGSYVFKNMTVDTNTTKGIKIKSAKSVVIENCVFDATKLTPGANGVTSDVRSLSAIDIDITNASCNMSVTIKNCTFTKIPFSGTDHTKCTAGAIKIKSQDVAHKFDSVVIENNTFVDCCRDIVIGKADDGSTKYHTRTFDATCAKWTVKGNTSTLTAESIKDIEVKTAVSTTKIGKMVGGCAVFDVADAYTDTATSSVKFN